MMAFRAMFDRTHARSAKNPYCSVILDILRVKALLAALRA
jgi:hypothetical protein